MQIYFYGINYCQCYKYALLTMLLVAGISFFQRTNKTVYVMYYVLRNNGLIVSVNIEREIKNKGTE